MRILGTTRILATVVAFGMFLACAVFYLNYGRNRGEMWVTEETLQTTSESC